MLKKTLLILLLWASCQSAKDGGSAKQRQVFVQYLQEWHEYEAQPGDVFILIPRLICKGCVEMKLMDLEAILENDSLPQTRIITSNPRIIPPSLEKKIIVWHDIQGWLDRVNLPIANMTLVHFGPEEAFAMRSIPTTDEQNIKVWLKAPEFKP